MNIVGYQVFDPIAKKWLDCDEHSWTDSFFDAAQFTDYHLANDIRERESGDRGTFVLAILQ